MLSAEYIGSSDPFVVVQRQGGGVGWVVGGGWIARRKERSRWRRVAGEEKRAGGCSGVAG